MTDQNRTEQGFGDGQGTTETITVRTFQNGATPPSEQVQLLVAPYDEQLDLIQDASQAIFEIVDASGQPLPLAPALPVGPDGTTVVNLDGSESRMSDGSRILKNLILNREPSQADHAPLGLTGSANQSLAFWFSALAMAVVHDRLRLQTYSHSTTPVRSG